jgi:hypothetical protein
VRAEHAFERRRIAALGQALEPPAQASNAPNEADDREREGEDDDDQPTDDRTDVGRDERVDVDQEGLRGRVGRV